MNMVRIWEAKSSIQLFMVDIRKYAFFLSLSIHQANNTHKSVMHISSYTKDVYIPGSKVKNLGFESQFY